jgi:hypothetical protein
LVADFFFIIIDQIPHGRGLYARINRPLAFLFRGDRSLEHGDRWQRPNNAQLAGFLASPAVGSVETDWVADVPVDIEPVSGGDSLLTRKLTGNFVISARRR